MCGNKTGECLLQEEGTWNGTANLLQNLFACSSDDRVVVPCPRSSQDICIDASFLLQDSFLLLVAHILHSVFKLKCKCRILGRRGKEQEKNPCNFKSNLISFWKKQCNWTKLCPRRTGIGLYPLLPSVVQLSPTVHGGFWSHWEKSMGNSIVSACFFCFILSAAWFRARRFPSDKGRSR